MMSHFISLIIDRLRLACAALLIGMLLPGCTIFQGKSSNPNPDSLFEMGYFQQAADAYRQILDKDPKNIGAARGLGLSEYAQKHYLDAIPALSTWTELGPDHFEAFRYLGLAHARAGDHPVEAISALEKAITLFQNDNEDQLAEVYYGLMLAHCQQKQFKECIDVYKETTNRLSRSGIENFFASEDRSLLKKSFDEYIGEKGPTFDFSSTLPGTSEIIQSFGADQTVSLKTGQKVEFKGAPQWVNGPWHDSLALVKEASENMIANPSIEIDAEGWIPFQAVATRSTEAAWIGEASLKVETQPGESLGRVSFDVTNVITDTNPYTFSIWI